IRWLPRSAPYTWPRASVAMESGKSNCPCPDPREPQDLRKRPSLSNFATRALPNPSATKMLPPRSPATSGGRLKVSPGPPAPGLGPRPPRPASETASGLRPSVFTMRPSGENSITMLEPRSTTQIWSLASTRTACANRKPYTPSPISRTNLPVRSNSNRREPPCVKVRDAPHVALAPPVRVYTKRLPLELVATPAASPRWMRSGSFSGSGAESKAICAQSEVAIASVMMSIPWPGHECLRYKCQSLCPPHRMQRQLLHTPRNDLAHQQFVLVAAIDFVHGRELAQVLARVSELADNGSVQFHLVNLAGHRVEQRIVAVRIRVGAVEILVGPGGDAHGPGRPHPIVDGLEGEVVVEDLNAAVGAVADVDVAFGIRRHGMRQIQLAGRPALAAHRRDEASILAVLNHARIAVAVGDENVPRRVPGHVGGTIECVRLR